MSSIPATDTETQVEQLAAGLEKTPAELRAKLWETIAEADVPISIDVEEFYEDLVDQIYSEAVEDINSSSDETSDDEDLEAAASAESDDFDLRAALNQWADHDAPLEAYGTGISGDRSREEYLEREKQIDILTEALERADVDRSDDQE